MIHRDIDHPVLKDVNQSKLWVGYTPSTASTERSKNIKRPFLHFYTRVMQCCCSSRLVSRISRFLDNFVLLVSRVDFSSRLVSRQVSRFCEISLRTFLYVGVGKKVSIIMGLSPVRLSPSIEQHVLKLQHSLRKIQRICHLQVL